MTIFAVATVATISVAIAISGIAVVDVVNYDGDIAYLVVVNGFKRLFEDVFYGVVLADNDDIGVGPFREKEGIGNRADRRGVDDDDVVFLFKLLHHLFAIVTDNQLGRVGRDCT